MNKNSIIFSTTLNFLITSLLLIVSFIFLLSHENFKKNEQIFERYKPIIKMVSGKKFYFDKDFHKNLLDMNYELFESKEEIKNILSNNKKMIFARSNKHNETFKIFEIDGKIYLFFEKFDTQILIKDLESQNLTNSFYTIFVFVSLLIVITILYINTLKKLLPLKELKDKVINFGDEKFDFELSNSSSKDEVTLLANEFKKSAQKLKNIKESRNIFIRNIMHELKTPITKGKFLLQLEKSDENIEKLKMVFNRLESLINEFATIEELISQNRVLEKKSYFLEDLLDNAKDILMIDDNCVKNSYENIKLNVNFKLFSIAIKNLIDNAIKYSNDKKVEVLTQNEDILFVNSGKKLEGDFEKYLEPFYSKSSNESFGLGLYIVFNILKANGYNLLYKYEDGKNIFIVKKG
ncbi:ArsS family sensor histidine kinase [Aliarcobacter cryaerophilus]|jgi:two-component system OmpR family sensor kinase|uniref:histidine kinase n=1 Tax=Aliarcobacter cryaerophilus TaxID=28198 RepID=A0A1V9VBA4_9BACT|nr:ArsS family sensor histidine kinase [Aliarcobacter cryaerophilus]MCT7487841.1 ArsS family sensor histidine kinase [Aliarcobacter cryaerophilus]MCT7492918.1 ArsS family sensor histidine kinase [Aliarcobacter cryaerophilus]OQR41078.1 sensor histidine kinase [Aliarcobacter cryaerophilus]QNM92892.1 HAMP domain-containing histidine kinase [Aliarcobacter cryaerophilus]UYF43931.1 ArsS family sensor histidine kinase [Aliarcobacter cryaerophilus]